MPGTNANFDPTILSGTILRQLRTNLVTDNMVNRNFEGEITGPEDTVDILTLDDLTISDYSPSSGITVETEPTAKKDTLPMTHAKYFAFIADEADNAGAEQYAEIFQQEGLQQLLEAAQGFVMEAYNDALSANQVTFDEAGGDDIENKIADAGENLDEQNVPDEGRFITLPPHEVRLIEDKISDRGTELGDETVRAGFQGMFRGLEVYKLPSSQFETTGSSPQYEHAMYGSRIAITYADAVLNVRRQQSERYRGDQIDGLHVGGKEVVREEALGDFRIKQ